MNTLQAVEKDASSPLASQAFMAFFKTIANRDYVTTVLQNILAGAPLPIPSLTKDIAPAFVCVDKPGDVTFGEVLGENGTLFDAYDMCTDLSAVTLFLENSALEPPEIDPFIVLCPKFFELPPAPSPSYSNCLLVDPHFNRFVEGGTRIQPFGLWRLFDSLLEAYVKDSSSTAVDANESFQLSASEAVNNDASWIYYAASESSYGFPLFPQDRGGC